MTKVQRLGRDDTSDRELFLLELRRIEEVPDNFRLSSRYFTCLLAWDARDVSAGEIRSAARKLIDQGAAYFCLWGPDCERVHDVLDEVEATRARTSADDESVIMTSWHDNEPLSEAIWFVLRCTCPDEPYIDECKSTLAIAVASPEWASEIRSALRNPRKFSDKFT